MFPSISETVLTCDVSITCRGLSYSQSASDCISEHVQPWNQYWYQELEKTGTSMPWLFPIKGSSKFDLMDWSSLKNFYWNAEGALLFCSEASRLGCEISVQVVVPSSEENAIWNFFLPSVSAVSWVSSSVLCWNILEPHRYSITTSKEIGKHNTCRFFFMTWGQTQYWMSLKSLGSW